MVDIIIQTCKQCNAGKPLTDFPLRKWKTPSGALREGPRKICYACQRTIDNARYADPEKSRRTTHRAYKQKHAVKIAAQRKAYYEANRAKWLDPETGWRFSEKAKSYDLAYRTDPEIAARKREYDREWRQANKPHLLAKARLRQTHVARATPKWANLDAIRAVYEQAAQLTAETGAKHHVDHYYPLKGRLVCGLHVENNLQIITADANWRKANKHPE